MLLLLFLSSFIEHLFGSGSESEFDGFMREEVYFAEGSQVRILHERGEEGDKENQPDQAPMAPVKKRTRTRSR